MKTLDPYSGSWTDQNQRTILNRTLFGYTKTQWNSMSEQSIQDLINELLALKPLPDPPAKGSFPSDSETSAYSKARQRNRPADRHSPRRNDQHLAGQRAVQTCQRLSIGT